MSYALTGPDGRAPYDLRGFAPKCYDTLTPVGHKSFDLFVPNSRPEDLPPQTSLELSVRA